METLDSPLIDLLLQSGGAVALQLDPDGRLLRVANAARFQGWLPAGSAVPAPGTPLPQLLSLLFEDARAAQLLHELAPPAALTPPTSLTLPAVPGRALRLAPPRWFDVMRALVPAGPAPLSLLVITDCTPQQTLANAAAEARTSQELALAVLRTDAAVLRRFLQNAGSALGFIRATLRQTSRTQEALRDKLHHLHQEATVVTASAAELALHAVSTPGQELVDALEQLLAMESATGDDLLPLALRIDALSAAIAATTALDEQRAAPSPEARAATPRSAARAAPAWHDICEQRANELIQRLGSGYGVLARLRMKGAALVPGHYHRQIDAALEPLIDNALRHGIEPPEFRLAAEKLAAGTITITFRNQDSNLEMSVHDDGRGFDVERIRAAAVACGLVPGDRGEAMEARELVGLIFKSGFSTQSLDDGTGTGRSMALLRESLQRRGGNVSVATKPLRYTQFTLRFVNAAGRRTAAQPEPP